jgi:hypothetical protein
MSYQGAADSFDAGGEVMPVTRVRSVKLSLGRIVVARRAKSALWRSRSPDGALIAAALMGEFGLLS